MSTRYTALHRNNGERALQVMAIVLRVGLSREKVTYQRLDPRMASVKRETAVSR